MEARKYGYRNVSTRYGIFMQIKEVKMCIFLDPTTVVRHLEWPKRSSSFLIWTFRKSNLYIEMDKGSVHNDKTANQIIALFWPWYIFGFIKAGLCKVINWLEFKLWSKVVKIINIRYFPFQSIRISYLSTYIGNQKNFLL